MSGSDKILLVDDTQNMLNMTRTILSSIGFKDIDTAMNGYDAWKLITNPRNNYGLILSDWEMPKMDGLDLLKKVRGHDKYKNVPFIIISGTSELDKVKKAIIAGVTDYIVKPISQDKIEEKVKTYITVS